MGALAGVADRDVFRAGRLLCRRQRKLRHRSVPDAIRRWVLVHRSDVVAAGPPWRRLAARHHPYQALSRWSITCSASAVTRFTRSHIIGEMTYRRISSGIAFSREPMKSFLISTLLSLMFLTISTPVLRSEVEIECTARLHQRPPGW